MVPEKISEVERAEGRVGWVRDRHLSGAQLGERRHRYQRTGGGKNEDNFHSGYVEFQMTLSFPAGIWDWSSGEGIGSRRHII